MKSTTQALLAGILAMTALSFAPQALAAQGSKESGAGSSSAANASITAGATAAPAQATAVTSGKSGDSHTPVQRWGMLQVKGRQVCSQQGEPVQLRGMSLFWSQWGSRFYTPQAVAWTASEWKASVVRIAMGVESGGYLENPVREERLVNRMVEAARAAGIYAIIDWHDHHASCNQEDAEAFFGRMALKYKDDPGVIFEIYNEPLANESWESVKEYSQALIDLIRKQGARQLILVGSPSWDQRLDLVAQDPIADRDNIAYTMHFYAGTHGESLRSNTRKALEAGLAVFCSEFGTCDASGNGKFSPGPTGVWLDFLDKEGISWCNWSLTDKDETASALKPRSSATGGWTDKDLTESGLLVRDRLLRGDPDLSGLKVD